MIRDVRLATGAFVLACALALPPIPQALLLAVVWLLPHLGPSVFTPASPSRSTVWAKFQPYSVVFVFLSVVIQGAFGPAPRMEMPLPPLSPEGMEMGLVTSLRAILLLSGVLAVLLPLPPLELAGLLSRLRLPIGLPIAVLLSLLLIEELPRTIRQTRVAQLSRGLDLSGGLLKRIRALRSLLTPLVMRTLEGSLERATALQLRGLTDPIRLEHPPTPLPRLAAVLFALSVLLLIVWILQWTGLLQPII